MSRIKDSRYIYAVSRIRAIENKLLGRKGIDRMLDAQTPEQALKVLLEADYGYPRAGIPAPADYEKLLEEEYKKLYALLREVSPDPGVFDIFLQRYDFHNIKVILKAEFAEVRDYDSLLSNKGSMEAKRLKAILRDRRLTELPSLVREAVEETIMELNHTRDPQSVELILDRACCRRMKEMADQTGSRFLIDFIATMIDYLNIQIFYRLKKLNKEVDFMRRTLLPGGYLKPEILLEIEEDSISRLETALWNTPYREAASKMVRWCGDGSCDAFPERLSDEFISDGILKGSRKISGLEPLVGYMLGKETELRNVRTVMAGKINGISSDRIRERLRAAYA